MGRPLRASHGGMVYHVLNRANARLPLFETPSDYRAFESVLAEAVERASTRLLAYCVMPNHWHLLVWPHEEGELSAFVGWLTLTHTQRWHAHHDTVGTGHLYQGRFKSFLVQEDTHLLAVWRYVERNPLRSGLVARADAWRYGSLWRREHGDLQARRLLSEGPVLLPRGWCAWVQDPQTAEELEALEECTVRGRPYGGEAWVQRTVEGLGLETTLRPRGRPKKVSGTFFSGTSAERGS